MKRRSNWNVKMSLRLREVCESLEVIWVVRETGREGERGNGTRRREDVEAVEEGYILELGEGRSRSCSKEHIIESVQGCSYPRRDETSS